MVGFLPTNDILTQTDELKNVSYSITYTDALGVSYPVTITPVNQNSTISINGNTLNGYFSESFYNEIYYRNKDDTFTTCYKFSEINEDTISELIHYFADTTTDVTYNYIATANGQTKNYQIVVTNNWDNGRTLLLKYVNSLAYGEKVRNWLDSSSNIRVWVNNSGTKLNWIAN